MYIVFDIGGSNTRIAKSDGKTIINTQIIPTEKEFENQIQMMSEITEKLKEGEKIETAAGGVAGTLSQDKSVLFKSPHIQEWTQRPLKAELETLFDAPVYLENDSHLGGLGEACFGAGQGFKIVAYIAIGTGLGGARIVDKKIDRNSNGFEIGHQTISMDGGICACGGTGHLESYIAGSYLKNIYGVEAENIKDEKIWNELTKYLSFGINNTIVHWSPDVVILGGAVSSKISLDILSSYVNKNLRIFPSPEIVKGTLGQEAGLLGALELIKNTNPD